MTSENKDTKVLITGGAGYLGSVLTEKMLDKGYQVRVLDNLMYGQSSLFHLCYHPNLEFLQGDVRDIEVILRSLKGVDAVIPLAAIVGEPACRKDNESAITINLEAIKHMFLYGGRNQLVIFPNTNSGYGTKPEGVICNEDTPLKAISLYGQTKNDAENVVLQNPNSIVLRLATVFGMSPRMRLDLMVNDFVYKAVTQRSLTIFEGHFNRNFIHIRDVADCFIYCLENKDSMKGQAYNLGLDSANMTKLQLALKIQQHVPGLEIFESELGKDPDKRNYIVSNEKLRRAGFEAKRTLDEGITELIKGYKMMGRSNFSNV